MMRQSASLLSRVAQRSAMTTAASRGICTVKLPDLTYDYGALAPVISPQIMELHHSKHHMAYVTNYNIAAEKYAEAEAKGDLATMIAMQGAIKFNGGGHVNHSIFWTNLAPVKDCAPPSGDLLAAIDAEYGSVDAMIAKANVAGAGVQGSGWVWLGYNKDAGRVQLATTANQDPCSTTGLVPLLGIDVWEHAYYLDVCAFLALTLLNPRI